MLGIVVCRVFMVISVFTTKLWRLYVSNNGIRSFGIWLCTFYVSCKKYDCDKGTNRYLSFFGIEINDSRRILL